MESVMVFVYLQVSWSLCWLDGFVGPSASCEREVAIQMRELVLARTLLRSTYQCRIHAPLSQDEESRRYLPRDADLSSRQPSVWLSCPVLHFCPLSYSKALNPITVVYDLSAKLSAQSGRPSDDGVGGYSRLDTGFGKRRW